MQVHSSWTDDMTVIHEDMDHWQHCSTPQKKAFVYYCGGKEM